MLFGGVLSFEETLKSDIDWAERVADGRVFSGKTVEAVRLGRLNEAGSM